MTNNFGFWKKLKEEKAKIGLPIFALAPMADVTDAAFRFIIAKYSKYDGKIEYENTRESLPAEALCVGGPDVMWTEFVSADGLILGGYEKLKIDLEYSESERPIVAQLFGANPDTMEKSAALVEGAGFDGLDINMGCPDKSIEKQGAGAAMIKNPELAVKIIEAARRGAPNIPVTVKTRLGYNKNEIETWLPILLETNVPVITIHARTRKEMSKVPAQWQVIKRAVEIRDELGSKALIIGNGDVLSVEDGIKKARESGCDGVMLGKAIFGNPFLFDTIQREVRVSQQLKTMIEHTELFEKLLGKYKNFAVMKKHYKAYVEGFAGAKELRMKLMEANSAAEVREITEKFLLDTVDKNQ